MDLKNSCKKSVPICLLTVLVALLLALSGCVDKGGRTRGPLMVNSPAPVFTLQDTGGRTWSLSDLRGKVVLINFWATWCPSCIQEMPSIHNLNVLAGGAENFQILTVLYQDTPEKAAAYFRNEGFGMPVLIDKDSKAAAMYGLTGVPETFIIDKKGVLRKKFLGPWKFDSPDVVKLLNSLLEEQS